MTAGVEKRSPCAEYAPEPAFDDGRITLYHGDSRVNGPVIEPDLIVADPPYGETSLAWDRWPTDWPLWMPGRSMWCFGSMRMFIDHADEFERGSWKMSQDIVWEKHNGSGFAADRFKRVHECAVHWYRGAWDDLYHEPPRVSYSGPSKSIRKRGATVHTGAIGLGHYDDDGTRLVRSVIFAQSCQGSAVHPTQKPTSILEPLIEYGCPPNGLVLDPFAGSGSTLIAARHLGRRAVGIEARADYIEAAVMRLSQGALDLAGVAQSDGYPATGGES